MKVILYLIIGSMMAGLGYLSLTKPLNTERIVILIFLFGLLAWLGTCSFEMLDATKVQ